MEITRIMLCLCYISSLFSYNFPNLEKLLKFNKLLVKKTNEQTYSSLFGYRNPFFGSNQFHWLSTGRDLCLSKVSVAADYSDSVPDSSNYINDRGYHPLEELKFRKRARDTKLTSAEIARTTVEVCVLTSLKLQKPKCQLAHVN